MAGKKKTEGNVKAKPGEQKVIVCKNGPYLVLGGLPLAQEMIITDKEGLPVRWKGGKKYPVQKTYSLCRCGNSKHSPFCDGTHKKIRFEGTETASKKKYLAQAKKTSGPTLILTDVEDLCALAHFCVRAGGVWELTRRSDDPKLRKLAIQEACNCPAGRLVVWDKKTGKAIEPKFKKSISLTENPEEGVIGPIWLKGNVILVSADGTEYEKRNHITLCRCGKSRNKPFCDGMHTI